MSFCSQALRRCCWMLKWEYQGRGATTLQRSWYGMHLVTPLLTLYALVWLHITASRLTPCCWPNTNQTNTPGKKSQTGWEEKSPVFFSSVLCLKDSNRTVEGRTEEMLKLWRVWDVASDLQQSFPHFNRSLHFQSKEAIPVCTLVLTVTLWVFNVGVLQLSEQTGLQKEEEEESRITTWSTISPQRRGHNRHQSI